MNVSTISMCKLSYDIPSSLAQRLNSWYPRSSCCFASPSPQNKYVGSSTNVRMTPPATHRSQPRCTICIVQKRMHCGTHIGNLTRGPQSAMRPELISNTGFKYTYIFRRMQLHGFNATSRDLWGFDTLGPLPKNMCVLKICCSLVPKHTHGDYIYLNLKPYKAKWHWCPGFRHSR